MEFAVVTAILAGITIELFFRAIKYHSRESTQRPLPKYQAYNNYITVSEYIASGDKRILNYLLFRGLPPTIILILSMALYQRYFSGVNHTLLLFISIFVSLLPRDLFYLFKKQILLSEKIFHTTVIVSLLVLTLILSLVYPMINIAFIAPSLDGLIDNLWSSLFVAVLLILYLDATNQNKISENEMDDIKRSNYVVSSYEKITKKYGKYIERYSLETNTYTPLLYAILIFENMNRPEWVRGIENLVVRFLRMKLTVGIAQVYSTRPLTDIESIQVASEYLKASAVAFGNKTSSGTEEQRDIIGSYNSDEVYVPSIMNILGIMEKYTPNVFKTLG